MRKATAALVLGSMRGREFDGIITGASPKGTWVRIFDPPAEGRLEQGSQGLDVGDRVRVRLKLTDPERGFIDFARAGHGWGKWQLSCICSPQGHSLRAAELCTGHWLD